LTAYQNGYVHLHSRVAIRTSDLPNKSFTDWQKDKYLITTVGKIIFNEIMPPEFPYLNEPTQSNLEEQTPDHYFVPYGTDIPAHIKEQELVKPFKKKNLGNIIAEVFKRFKVAETSKMLDRMKNLGYKYSTKSGITVGIADISNLEQKEEIMADADKQGEPDNKTVRRDLITDDEREEAVMNVWNKTKDIIQEALMESLNDQKNLFMVSDTGARGNSSNVSQLAGMRGL